MHVTYQLPQHRRDGRRTYQVADFSPLGLDRYIDLQFRAVGAYGVVVSAVDTTTQASSNKTAADQTTDDTETCSNINKVAIKKMTLVESAKFHLLVLREIRILSRLSHENIIDIRDMLLAPRPESDDEWQLEPPIERSIFLVQSLMEFDLHTLLRRRRLSDEHVCCFLYQILRGLKYIHSARVVHRDLKPNNILLNVRCELKICDFGQSRLVERSEQNQHLLTEYVVTRWYRAPEIMLNPCTYTQAVDVWAVGCIFGEMLCNRPLFTGDSPTHQVDKIIAVLGTPTAAELDAIGSSTSARAYIDALPHSERQPWPAILGERVLVDSPHITDLLDKLLKFNPEQRVTAEKALEHVYVAAWHDADDEPTCSETIAFEPNVDEMSVRDLEKLLVNEIDGFRLRRSSNGGTVASVSPTNGSVRRHSATHLGEHRDFHVI